MPNAYATHIVHSTYSAKQRLRGGKMEYGIWRMGGWEVRLKHPLVLQKAS